MLTDDGINALIPFVAIGIVALAVWASRRKQGEDVYHTPEHVSQREIAYQLCTIGFKLKIIIGFVVVYAIIHGVITHDQIMYTHEKIDTLITKHQGEE